MTKKNKTPFGIFTEAIGLYFSNFGKFTKYMTFPVFGQILGLILTLICTLVYSKHLPNLIEQYKIFNNFNTLVLVSVVVAIPGLIIFIKAFWEYLVAYGAINSMLENMLKSGKVYDFSAHTELIKRRTTAFVSLWLIIGIFSLLASFPLFWVPAGVVAIYLALVFQIFTYEPELSSVGCIKESFNLIKGHFLPTFMLIAMAGLLCWVFIPQIFDYIFNILGVNKFISTGIIPVMEVLPFDEINSFLSEYKLPMIKEDAAAMFVSTTIVTQILIQYTLPLRSIMCGLWYKELKGSHQNTEKKKTSKKRPSEKLMEESHKKLTKRLDKNILKRASEKNDDE